MMEGGGRDDLVQVEVAMLVRVLHLELDAHAIDEDVRLALVQQQVARLLSLLAAVGIGDEERGVGPARRPQNRRGRELARRPGEERGRTHAPNACARAPGLERVFAAAEPHRGEQAGRVDHC